MDEKLIALIQSYEEIQGAAYMLLRRHPLLNRGRFDVAVTVTGARQMQARLAEKFLELDGLSDRARELAEEYRTQDAYYRRMAIDYTVPIREFEDARTAWLEAQSAFVDRVILELKGYETQASSDV